MDTTKEYIDYKTTNWKLCKDGQFEPDLGGQFAPDRGGQLRPDWGGHIERMSRPK